MGHLNQTLRRSKIEEAIVLFQDYESHQTIAAGTDSYNIITKIKGLKVPAMITVKRLVSGNTSILDHVGKNVEYSQLIATHVVEICSVPLIESKRLYIKKMDDGDFNTLIEYLAIEPNINISEPTPIQNGNKYAVTWHEGGVIYLNRYDNSAFSVQGNSNHVKEIIVDILSNVLPLKDIILAQLTSLDVNITADQVLSDIEIRMPYAFTKMSNALKSILSPSFALQTVNIELEDYSAFTFPILRTTEGVLREAYDANGITLGEGNVGSIFDKDPGTGEYFLQAAHSSKLNRAMETAITNLYNVHNKQRHQLFHIGDLVEIPRILETKEDADNIVEEAITAIEYIYKQLS